MASNKLPVFIVAGIGNGSGTGASSARVFARAGYRVAVVARNVDHLKKLSDEINASGGTAAAFPVKEYSYESIAGVFSDVKRHWPDGDIRATLWNAAYGLWKPFLDISPRTAQESINDNVVGPFAWARETILTFKELPPNEIGKRGTLLFTGATASVRGNTTTSAFSAGKHAVRALSQSLAKEFGKDDIHVAHAIIDGMILTDRWKEAAPGKYSELKEDGAAGLNPDSIASAYLYLANQDRTAWTWELDLRPAHEKW